MRTRNREGRGERHQAVNSTREKNEYSEKGMGELELELDSSMETMNIL